MKAPKFLLAPTGRRLLHAFNRAYVDLVTAWTAVMPAEKAAHLDKLKLPGWFHRVLIENRQDGFAIQLVLVAPDGTAEVLDEFAAKSLSADTPTAGRA